MKIRINLVKLVGNILALTMAYSMWKWTGVLFTLGLVLSNGGK